METSHHKFFSRKSVFIAVLIGLLATIILVFRDFDIEGYRSIQLRQGMWLILLGVVATLFFRIFGYMWRLRILSDRSITWSQSFQIVILWEFTSALTPTVIGGTAAALFLMARENMNTARSTSIVLLTAVLDEIYYLLAVPLLFLIVGFHTLFPSQVSVEGSFASNLTSFFIFGYVILLLYTLFLLVGLLWRPIVIKKLLFVLTRLPLLKRFRRGALVLGNDLQVTAAEFRHKSSSFWLDAFWATCLTWTARFLMINIILMGFSHLDLWEHLVVFGRQLTMWVILIFTPLPGAAGMAEGTFAYFLNEFIPAGVSAPLALIWRLFSYYFFIMAGAIVLPRWIKRTSKR